MPDYAEKFFENFHVLPDIPDGLIVAICPKINSNTPPDIFLHNIYAGETHLVDNEKLKSHFTYYYKNLENLKCRFMSTNAFPVEECMSNLFDQVITS